MISESVIDQSITLFPNTLESGAPLQTLITPSELWAKLQQHFFLPKYAKTPLNQLGEKKEAGASSLSQSYKKQFSKLLIN